MLITRKHIPRRTFLRGAGAVLALPVLDAMTPALSAETFEPQKALVRWILPGGLPYAIVGDIDALPRDIRTNVDVLAQFGPAAVVKRLHTLLGQITQKI